MADDATQPSTQQMLDPRRMGRNNSGIRETDISDVICILHPASPAAFRVVATTAERAPQHILQNDGLLTFEEGDLNALDEQETFLLRSEAATRAQDLALRFSSRTIRPVFGFCFGRNVKQCDVVFNVDTVKRVSNLHFRIYINRVGVLMLEDVSTNGTLVDGVHLKGRVSGKQPATRMLAGGSILEVPSSKPEESIKFIVRIPSRDRHEPEYRRRFEEYMNRITQIEEDLQRQQWQQAAKRNPGQTAPAQQRSVAAPHPVIASATFGMKWDGGNKYNVTGFLGKGAFAYVYQLTTSYDGRHLAVKELEKRRFVKDGVLDRRLNSEMQIMKSVKHPNIVEYVDYRDENDHLYIIMEYVPCGDLQQYLKAHEILAEPDAKLMARQTLRALAYLHANKITHRDIKPDNILLASTSPFTIKLSDFGLSKVVQTEDTFLTTFCGTLLYCAPEDFEKEEGRQGTKRRQPGGSGKQKFHSYSTAVDIWSFAGVLWFALCGYPPFEGVVDRSGRGMFEKIMRTDLDFRPLEAAGVPEDAKDLLKKMLSTVPGERPTAAECLRHPWLADGTDDIPEERDVTLRDIQEEEEEVGGGAEAEAEVFSQLSIKDHGQLGDEELQGLDDFDDFDFADVTRSKRVKIDGRYPRNQIRDKTDEESSDDVSGGAPILSQPPSTGQVLIDNGPNRGPRLFGEIGASALQSSGLLGEKTNIALAIHTREALELESRSEYYVSSNNPHRSAAASLLGTESLVRELNMESPYSGSHEESDWPSNSSADSFRQGNMGMTDRQPASYSPVSQETPKARQAEFGRRFEVPMSSMGSANPYRSRSGSTPTQARQTAGIPVWPSSLNNPPSVDDSVINHSGRGPTPEGSDSAASHQQAPNADVHPIPSDVLEDFKANPPRYGTLVSTADSKHTLFLRIDNRTTTWGRDPSNSLVHPDVQDTRIPKRAFGLIYNAASIERYERESKDWTTLPGLHVLIKCRSTAGLWVNGIKLEDKGPNGEDYCGRVQTGDVITIFQPRRDTRQAGETLRFVCTFNFGDAAIPRAEGKPFEVLTRRA
jgi:serine/threonine protein kinase